MLLVFEYKETVLEKEALHGNVTGAAAVILDKSLADVLKSTCIFKWKLELLYFPLSPQNNVELM